MKNLKIINFITIHLTYLLLICLLFFSLYFYFNTKINKLKNNFITLDSLAIIENKIKKDNLFEIVLAEIDALQKMGYFFKYYDTSLSIDIDKKIFLNDKQFFLLSQVKPYCIKYEFKRKELVLWVKIFDGKKKIEFNDLPQKSKKELCDMIVYSLSCVSPNGYNCFSFPDKLNRNGVYIILSENGVQEEDGEVIKDEKGQFVYVPKASVNSSHCRLNKYGKWEFKFIHKGTLLK